MDDAVRPLSADIIENDLSVLSQSRKVAMPLRFLLFAVLAISCGIALLAVAAQFTSSDPFESDFPADAGYVTHSLHGGTPVIRFFEDQKLEGLNVAIDVTAKALGQEQLPRDVSLHVSLDDTMHERWYIAGATGSLGDARDKRQFNDEGAEVSVDGPIDGDDLQRATEIDLLGLAPNQRYLVEISVLPRHGDADVKRALEAIHTGKALSIHAHFMK